MYFVYIIRSGSRNSFYTGITTDLERRLSEHNGHHSSTRTTKKLSDYELVYCQIAGSRGEARTLEKYLKSGSGREIRDEIIDYISLGL